MESPIGILDSGIGGLTILNSIRNLLPYERFVYVADHKYLPYGEKSSRMIRSRINRIIRYLISEKSKLIVIACNTATVAGISSYRKKFPDVPIIGVVPVVKKAAEETVSGHIAILSTGFTTNSTYQKNLIRQYASGLKVDVITGHNLVTAVESGDIRSGATVRELESVLAKIRNTSVDVLALGCTHYPFLKDTIRSIVGQNVRIMDSSDAVARQTKRILAANGIIAATGSSLPDKYITTGNITRINRTVASLIGDHIRFTGAVI